MNPPLMRFDPATGSERPYPSHSAQWREYHGQTAWLFNPYTGDRRKAEDVGLDPFGQLIDSLPMRDVTNTVPASRQGTTSTVMVCGAAFKRLELALEALKQLHKSFNHSGQPLYWSAQAARLDQIKVAAQELVERGAQ